MASPLFTCFVFDFLSDLIEISSQRFHLSAVCFVRRTEDFVIFSVAAKRGKNTQFSLSLCCLFVWDGRFHRSFLWRCCFFSGIKRRDCIYGAKVTKITSKDLFQSPTEDPDLRHFMKELPMTFLLTCQL